MTTATQHQASYTDALERLWDMLSDTIESGRLTEADIPDDYQALVITMQRCEVLRAATREQTPPAVTEPEDDASKLWFRNHYACPTCDIAWEDEWDCQCDDECPECGVAYTPTHSDDLTEEA